MTIRKLPLLISHKTGKSCVRACVCALIAHHHGCWDAITHWISHRAFFAFYIFFFLHRCAFHQKIKRRRETKSMTNTNTRDAASLRGEIYSRWSRKIYISCVCVCVCVYELVCICKCENIFEALWFRYYYYYCTIDKLYIIYSYSRTYMWVVGIFPIQTRLAGTVVFQPCCSAHGSISCILSQTGKL